MDSMTVIKIILLLFWIPVIALTILKMAAGTIEEIIGIRISDLFKRR